MPNEFKAISRLFQQRVPFQHPLTQLANGDDASVHQVPAGYEIVMSTDTAVASVHWPVDMPLHIAGNRAVCAALSDLAAMGAKATWVWLAVMAENTSALQAMSNGIVQACLDHQVELAGGDTVSSPTNCINVTVAGLLPAASSMTRALAQVDDEIWVIGSLGLSALGLKHWQTGQQHGEFVHAFQHIQPLLQQGEHLRELGIRCCIDVSDGLLQDASHIAQSSQVSLHIALEKLQCLPSFQQLKIATDDEQALQLTLNGGEDYTLLCTAPSNKKQQLLSLGAKPIGHCTPGQSVQLIHHGKVIPYTTRGYDHFA